MDIRFEGWIKSEPYATAMSRHCYSIYGPYELRVIAPTYNTDLDPLDMCAHFVVDTRSDVDVTKEVIDSGVLDGIAEMDTDESGTIPHTTARHIPEVLTRLRDHFKRSQPTFH